MIQGSAAIIFGKYFIPPPLFCRREENEGHVKMKKAIVCILLVLALTLPAFAVTPNASSQTSDVKILSYTYRFDSSGILVVIGEVQNQGQNVVGTVILSGTAKSGYGNEVLSGDLAWANNLLPGQKAPFYMQFRSNLTSSGAWTGGISEISIRVIQAEPITSYQYQGVVITSHKASQTSGTYSVSGEIKNTGSQTATNVAVVATFYNSEGKPVAVGYSTKEAMMAPEGINSFTLSALNFNQTAADASNKISKYELMVQVEEPLLTGTLPAAPAPVTGPDSQIDTPTGNNLSPAFIAIFIVAIVVVIGLWVLIKRRNSTKIKSPKKSIKHNHNRRRRRR